MGQVWSDDNTAVGTQTVTPVCPVYTVVVPFVT